VTERAGKNRRSRLDGNPVVNAYRQSEEQECFVFHQASARKNEKIENRESQECLH